MLTKNVYANIRGESKEVIDAMIAVAEATGFSATKDYGYDARKVDFKRKLIFINDEGVIDGVPKANSEYKKQISINDWLFSLAPDWATGLDIYDGNYYYVDDEYFYKINGLGSKLRKGDDETQKQIATRELAPQFKKGDKISFPFGVSSRAKGTIKAIDGDMAWIKTDSGGYVDYKIKALKPLEPTQEEILIDDMVGHMSEFYNIDNTKLEPNTRSRAKEMAQHLIKLGWAKK